MLSRQTGYKALLEAWEMHQQLFGTSKRVQSYLGLLWSVRFCKRPARSAASKWLPSRNWVATSGQWVVHHTFYNSRNFSKLSIQSVWFSCLTGLSFFFCFRFLHKVTSTMPNGIFGVSDSAFWWLRPRRQEFRKFLSFDGQTSKFIIFWLTYCIYLYIYILLFFWLICENLLFWAYSVSPKSTGNVLGVAEEAGEGIQFKHVRRLHLVEVPVRRLEDHELTRNVGSSKDFFTFERIFWY